MLFILHQLLIRIYDALGLFTTDVFTYEGVGRKRGGGENLQNLIQKETKFCRERGLSR